MVSLLCERSSTDQPTILLVARLRFPRGRVDLVVAEEDPVIRREEAEDVVYEPSAIELK